jgi:hypothetical protein
MAEFLALSCNESSILIISAYNKAVRYDSSLATGPATNKNIASLASFHLPLPKAAWAIAIAQTELDRQVLAMIQREAIPTLQCQFLKNRSECGAAFVVFALASKRRRIFLSVSGRHITIFVWLWNNCRRFGSQPNVMKVYPTIFGYIKAAPVTGAIKRMNLTGCLDQNIHPKLPPIFSSYRVNHASFDLCHTQFCFHRLGTFTYEGF